MSSRVFCASLAVIALFSAGACAGPKAASTDLVPQADIEAAAPAMPIKHVVIVVQENRTFDNLFATFPGANGATRGKEKIKQGSGPG